MKKTISLLLISLGTLYVGLAQNHQEVIEVIEQLVEQELNKDNVHNIFLSIYSPSRSFKYDFAQGTFRDGTEVTTSTPFYTASVGKTFTATAIGMLVDKGKVRFDDPISNYLPSGTMNELHILDGVDYGDSITIAHLLQHTSGLPDYFDTETMDDSPSMFDLILTEPNRFWEPEELISFSKAHFKSAFTPGNDYRYTDTEYVLLGMILEEISGLELHEFFEKEIFTPLNMKQTYLNLRSSTEQSKIQMAEMYVAEHEISSFQSLSVDWAGGAIVSTGRDLITFYSGLLNGRLVTESTLNAMQQWVGETKGMYYGFGLRKVMFNELSQEWPNWTVIGHSGLNGTSLYYCPDLDIYLAGTLNQLEASRDAVQLIVKVLTVCADW